MTERIDEKDLPRVSPAPTAHLRAVQGGKSVLVPLPDVANASALVADAIDGIESAGRAQMTQAIDEVESLGRLQMTQAVANVAEEALEVVEQAGRDASALLADTQTQVGAVLGGLGYLPPVAYASGLEMTSSRQTVSYGGDTYAPVADELPFTTSGTFDPAQWRLIQGVSGADLASASGAAMVGLSSGGSVEQAINWVSPEMFGAVGDGFTDDTQAWRSAVLACPAGGKIVCSPSANYLITLQDDLKCVEITKAISIDFNGARVTYKPWADASPASVHSPAFYYNPPYVGDSVPVKPLAHGDTEIEAGTSGDIAHINEMDWVRVSCSDIRRPWNYPRSKYTAFSGWSEVVQVKSKSGNKLTLTGHIYNDYPTGVVIRKFSPFEGITVSNLGDASEIDPNILSSKPLSENVGHFLSINRCVAAKVDNINVMGGHRMFAVWFGGCFNASAYRVRSRCVNPLYPPEGGHAYTIRHNGCTGAYTHGCVGHGTRHLIDYTASYNCKQDHNIALNCRAFAYVTHGFAERDILSEDDAAYTGSESEAGGWLHGNPSFAKAYNMTIVRPKFRGARPAILASGTAEGLVVIDPDIEVKGSTEVPVVVDGGLKDFEMRGGRVVCDMDAMTVRVGSYGRINTGAMTVTATAGTDPIVTVQCTNPHGLSVGDEFYVRLHDYAEGQYTGRWIVSAVDSPTQFKYVRSGTTTQSISASISGTFRNRRLHHGANMKSCANVKIIGTTLIPGPSAYAAAAISANGDIHLDVTTITSSTSTDALLVNEECVEGPIDSLHVTARTYGDLRNVLETGHQSVNKESSVTNCFSEKYTGYLWSMSGTNAQKLERWATNKRFNVSNNNVGHTTPCAGLVRAHLWTWLRNSMGSVVGGNSYPAVVSTGSYSINWESGTFTPAIEGATTAGTAAYSNRWGRYQLVGRSLMIQGRLSFSGFNGAGQMRVTGLPISFTDYIVPIAVGEASIPTATGKIELGWYEWALRIRQVVPGSEPTDVPVSSSGDFTFSGGVIL